VRFHICARISVPEIHLAAAQFLCPLKPSKIAPALKAAEKSAFQLSCMTVHSSSIHSSSPGAVNRRPVLSVLLFMAILRCGDSFLPSHQPSADGVWQRQYPLPLTGRHIRPFVGLFSLRGGGAEVSAGGEKKGRKPDRQLVPPGAVYGMGFGALTASRIAHVRALTIIPLPLGVRLRCVRFLSTEGADPAPVLISPAVQEAHLQGYYINTLGLPSTTVALGWTVFCIAIAALEPIVGMGIDWLRARGCGPSSKRTDPAEKVLLGLMIDVSLRAATCRRIATAHTLLTLLPLWLMSVFLSLNPPRCPSHQMQRRRCRRPCRHRCSCPLTR
jgi:hypothetical protein